MSFRILVVDDSATTRRIVERTLRIAKIPIAELVEAPHGAAALELLGESDFDVVIADINMPTMGGIEMLQWMNADDRLREVPVIILSTEGSLARIESLRSLGAKGYIRKPFTPEKVRDVLLSVMGEGEHAADQESA
jgi:two-component system chemotaxis response regulator CheY